MTKCVQTPNALRSTRKKQSWLVGSTTKLKAGDTKCVPRKRMILGILSKQAIFARIAAWISPAQGCRPRSWRRRLALGARSASSAAPEDSRGGGQCNHQYSEQDHPTTARMHIICCRSPRLAPFRHTWAGSALRSVIRRELLVVST